MEEKSSTMDNTNVATTTFLKLRFLDPQAAQRAKKLLIICIIIIIFLIISLVSNISSGENILLSLFSTILYFLLPVAAYFGLKKNELGLVTCFCGCSIVLAIYYGIICIMMIVYIKKAGEEDEKNGGNLQTSAIVASIALALVAIVMFLGWKFSVPFYTILRKRQFVTLPPSGIVTVPVDAVPVIVYGHPDGMPPMGGNYTGSTFVQPMIGQPAQNNNQMYAYNPNPYGGTRLSDVRPNQQQNFAGQGHMVSAYGHI
eukprot:GDKJ01013677.1.p1 GENE.GDKJ01013677.1~~GDKJ01013677.1.p1  ORF type:complete len:257 (+),score=24.42 GDKJ01013677.1:22-792(+)